MGRGSTQSLIREILKSLAESPKTISEIAEAIDLDRTAISRYVNLLKESGLLVEEQIGTSKKFTIIPTYREDTYFGLPLDKEVEKQISSVFYLIKKYWSEKTSKKLLNTHAQKIAFKVIRLCDELKIPFGWYLYGGIEVGTYDDSKNYIFYETSEKVVRVVKEVTEEYAINDYAWQSKKLQYEQAPEHYSVKEEILSILYGPTISEDPKRSLHVIIKKVRRLISLAPKVDRKEYNNILDAYQDLLLDLYNKVDDEVLKEHKREFIILFEAVWKYIALFNFKNDLLKFYPKKILDVHFFLDIKQQEDEIIELGSYLQSLVPEDEDPLRKKLNEALDKMLVADKEKLKKQNEELEKIKQEKGLEEFNEELFRRVGLD